VDEYIILGLLDSIKIAEYLLCAILILVIEVDKLRVYRDQLSLMSPFT
jgi:hypothetical protein